MDGESIGVALGVAVAVLVLWAAHRSPPGRPVATPAMVVDHQAGWVRTV